MAKAIILMQVTAAAGPEYFCSSGLLPKATLQFHLLARLSAAAGLLCSVPLQIILIIAFTIDSYY